ncbi:MAG: hypothetical protein JSU66_03010 [Deltaproteobacteria bacterium]|nr:MAG: hypothetical protein JSU66_03010 [Deltaproteobacteria bacterium]
MPSASAGRARIRGSIQAAVGITVGVLVYTYGSRPVGSVIATIGTIILLSALLSPTGLYAAIERGFTALGVHLGRFLTWLSMLTLFYLFFLPFGLLFRRGAKDPMRRFYTPDAATYWEDRELGRRGSSSHERQY